jgi:hypothetical protein
MSITSKTKPPPTKPGVVCRGCTRGWSNELSLGKKSPTEVCATDLDGGDAERERK